MKHLFLLLIGILCIEASFGQVKSQDFDSLPITTGFPVEVNGLMITPPQGYAFLSDIHSFINHLSQTSIAIQKDTNRKVDDFVSLLKEQVSEKDEKNILDFEKKERGYLITFAIEVQGIPVERVMYVFQENNAMYSVMANYKQQSRDKHRKLLVDAITSVKPI